MKILITGGAGFIGSNLVDHFLKEGQRLEYANSLIGQAMVELGKEKSNEKILNEGKWILDNSEKEQQLIDRKIAKTFEEYGEKNPKIKHILNDLMKDQNQSVADSLIANLLEIMRNEL